jgi:hypothetical protein
MAVSSAKRIVAASLGHVSASASRVDALSIHIIRFFFKTTVSLGRQE